MRALNALHARPRPDDEDRGAVMVMVALMMVALLGVGALTIDLGAIYAEKRQLQNGADAAALAVAQDCVGGNCAGATARARTYASLNAKDGVSAVDVVCGVGPGLSPCAEPAPTGAAGAGGWVRVRTSTQTADGGTQLHFLLAPIMGSLTGKTVHAQAEVAWGSPGVATATPLTISKCEYLEAGGIVPAAGASGVLPGLQVTAYFHSSAQAGHCAAGPSGGDAPGGFGWLDVDRACSATLTAGQWVSGSTGVALPNGCSPSTWRNQVVLIAVFDGLNAGTGSNLEYHLLGFAALQVTGYAFSSEFWSADPTIRRAKDLCPEAPGASAVCIVGRFVNYTTTAEGFGGSDLGVKVVRMVG